MTSFLLVLETFEIAMLNPSFQSLFFLFLFMIPYPMKQVEALRQLTQKELIDFFDKYIKVGAPLKKSLSVRVYGSAHSSEYKTDNSQTAESNVLPIEDIFSFRRSRPLYGSLKGGFGHLKL